MTRCALLCLAVLAAPAGAGPPSSARRDGSASRPATGRRAPVDPYAAPPKPARLPAKAKPTSPVDPYAISSEAARAAYAIALRQIVELREQALQLITTRLTAGQPVTEYEVMQVIVRGMAERALVGPAPTVAAGVNTDNPHYTPTVRNAASIQVGDPIVISLAGKIDKPEGVFASQTWCAIADKTVPKPIANAFAIIRRARDRAIAAAVRAAIGAAGHNRSRPAAADQQPAPSFTVGQGIYFADRFGLRSEVSVYLAAPRSEMTPPAQTAVQPLLP